MEIKIANLANDTGFCKVYESDAGIPCQFIKGLTEWKQLTEEGWLTEDGDTTGTSKKDGLTIRIKIGSWNNW